ncbi:MAG: hypothetical protein WB507_09455 [Solirubrobacterales bacterium]
MNSGRQIGGVFGTAILVLILGKTAVTGDPTQCYHLWWVAAAACVPAALTSLALTARRQTQERTGAVVSPLVAAPDLPVRETVAGPPNTHGATATRRKSLNSRTPDPQ